MTRQVKILNLDEIIADTAQCVIVWREKEHAVANMSVDTYLRYVAMEENLRKTLADAAAAAQMTLYLDIFALMVPTLPLEEIKREPLQVVTRLADFLMATVGDMMAAGGAGGAPNEAGNEAGKNQPGE